LMDSLVDVNNGRFGVRGQIKVDFDLFFGKSELSQIIVWCHHLSIIMTSVWSYGNALI